MTQEQEESSFLPVWIRDTEIDPKWIQTKAELLANSPVAKCTVLDISNDTRKGDEVRNGATLKLSVSFVDDDSSSLSLVIKQVLNSGLALSQQLGLAREALFSQHLAPQLENEKGSIIIPKIYYAESNMETGAKIVIMQDLSNN
jgi:5-methylthioribose kinase